MSKQIRIGSLHVAVIGDRRQRRIVLRTWRADNLDRAGRWAVASLAPLRVTVGREVSAAELV
jgi:hypothetical protein